jgi:hypothetical protein
VVSSLNFYQQGIKEQRTARPSLQDSFLLTANTSGSNLATQRVPNSRIKLREISKNQPNVIKSNSEHEIRLSSNSLKGKYELFLVGNGMNIPLDLSIESSNNHQQGLRIFSNNEPVNPQIIADQHSLLTPENGASGGLRLPNGARVPNDLSHYYRETTDDAYKTLETLLDMSTHDLSDGWYEHSITKGEGFIEEGLYGILESKNSVLIGKLEEIFSRRNADLETGLSDNKTIFHRALAYLGLEIKSGKNQEELPTPLNKRQIENIKNDLALLFLDVDGLAIQNNDQRRDIKKSYREEQIQNNNLQRREDHLEKGVPQGILKLISRRDENNNISSLIIKYNQFNALKTIEPLSIELRKIE